MIKARIRMVSGHYYDLTFAAERVFETFLNSLDEPRSSRFNFAADGTGRGGIEIVTSKVETVQWERLEDGNEKG